jgi:hypothetical protein
VIQAMTALGKVMRQGRTDGSVWLTADQCTFRFERLRPGVLLVTIDGYDHGQFGPLAVDEIAAEFARTWWCSCRRNRSCCI